jgi:polyribonucleotide nucleotidyltransferase
VVKIASSDAMASQRAVDWIRGLTATPEVGRIYEGKVARIVDFGAFVNFLGNQDGLVHISELANERVGKVSDVVKEGDQVKVKVLAIDDRGKIKLSMRAVDQQTGEELPVQPRPPRGDRGEGGGPRGDRRDGGGGGERRDDGERRTKPHGALDPGPAHTVRASNRPPSPRVKTVREATTEDRCPIATTRNAAARSAWRRRSWRGAGSGADRCS